MGVKQLRYVDSTEHCIFRPTVFTFFGVQRVLINTSCGPIATG
jgi:hypothetical protein